MKNKEDKIMAFKTKKEKYAYVKGIKKGMRGGKPYRKRKKGYNPVSFSTLFIKKHYTLALF